MMKKSGKIGSYELSDDFVISVFFKEDWEGERYMYLEMKTSTGKFSHSVISGVGDLGKFLIDCEEKLHVASRKDIIDSGARTEAEQQEIEKLYTKGSYYSPAKFFSLEKEEKNTKNTKEKK